MKLKDIRVTCRNYPGITFAIHTLSNDVAFIHPVNENWGTWVNVNTLELVTPVEELGPYSVGGSIDGCILYKNGEYYAEFVNSIDAERACKLLNAEWRKEQEK